MLLLALQIGLANKQRKIAILDLHLADARIEEVLDELPDAIRRRLVDVAAGDVGEGEHLALEDDLLVPFRQVVGLGHRDAYERHVVCLLLAAAGGLLVVGRCFLRFGRCFLVFALFVLLLRFLGRGGGFHNRGCCCWSGGGGGRRGSRGGVVVAIQFQCLDL